MNETDWEMAKLGLILILLGLIFPPLAAMGALMLVMNILGNIFLWIFDRPKPSKPIPKYDNVIPLHRDR